MANILHDKCPFRWVYRDPIRMASIEFEFQKNAGEIGRIQSSTLIAVLLAADRFGMNGLVGYLITLAGRLLTVGLFREILDVLENRQLECGNELSRG